MNAVAPASVRRSAAFGTSGPPRAPVSGVVVDTDDVKVRAFVDELVGTPLPAFAQALKMAAAATVAAENLMVRAVTGLPSAVVAWVKTPER